MAHRRRSSRIGRIFCCGAVENDHHDDNDDGQLQQPARPEQHELKALPTDPLKNKESQQPGENIAPSAPQIQDPTPAQTAPPRGMSTVITRPGEPQAVVVARSGNVKDVLAARQSMLDNVRRGRTSIPPEVTSPGADGDGMEISSDFGSDSGTLTFDQAMREREATMDKLFGRKKSVGPSQVK